MFKLVKILNSGVNVAEPRYMPTDPDTNYVAGSLVKVSSGIVTNMSAADTPVYLIGEDVSYGSKDRVLCYPLSSDMIFETTISASPVAVNVGDKVTFWLSGGSAQGVSANTTSGVAEIYDLAGATSAGDTVFVRFPN